jgi:hypothetical protein
MRAEDLLCCDLRQGPRSVSFVIWNFVSLHTPSGWKDSKREINKQTNKLEFYMVSDSSKRRNGWRYPTVSRSVRREQPASPPKRRNHAEYGECDRHLCTRPADSEFTAVSHFLTWLVLAGDVT